jgi:hypothetical protein
MGGSEEFMNQTDSVWLGRQPIAAIERRVEGELVDYEGERFYRILQAEAMKPFFMSIVSASDHWLFVASNGALTAGRQSPKFALFPYVTEDKIIDSVATTGPYTSIIAARGGKRHLWHPFRDLGLLVYGVTRRLYKNVVGSRIIFEEINRDLELTFRYEWKTSGQFGFVRECTLVNLGLTPTEIRILDGIQNLLPADVEEKVALELSCLLDAYRMNELFSGSTLAVYTLSAQVIDRAEPRESLHATSVWSHGLENPVVVLSSEQTAGFDCGARLEPVSEVRGRRGAYLVESEFVLQPAAEKNWLTVADVNQSQANVSRTLANLSDPDRLVSRVRSDVATGGRKLRQIVAATDGIQITADELSSAHHCANVLFNDMRGGTYAFGYDIPGRDFERFVKASNRTTWLRHRAFLEGLAELQPLANLASAIEQKCDPDLVRHGYEYLPLTWSRRHGDPSRPWNRFDIRVTNERGHPNLGFQGNWRDIFQNWEALSLSYPEFVEHLIVKFVNACTVDGYNPCGITSNGIDWEIPAPDKPWASIGYWGDHQIVYLLRLLELSVNHHPERLGQLLERPIFSYANVPYRIRPYADIARDPRDTIVFDFAKNEVVQTLARDLGSDGKLVHHANGVYHVTLIEKLLVSVLAKISNLVPGAGIWLNTQRPEWNDANNGLVGNGVSMVTLCHLERFVALLERLLESIRDRTPLLSREVATLLLGTLRALKGHRAMLDSPDIDDVWRQRFVQELGTLASEYREQVYDRGFSGQTSVAGSEVAEFVNICGAFLRHTLEQNRRADGLCHAYSVVVPKVDGEGLRVTHLYEMLEGQVAALGRRDMRSDEACLLLDALAQSRLYRADQHSYLLYPDRRLPSFLEKNIVTKEDLGRSTLLSRMVMSGDTRIVVCDAQARVRFRADLCNGDRCRATLASVRASGSYPELDDSEVERVLEIYESVFHHRTFVGRSGTMFAYEGLGSIYWHMVGKLLLSVQERFYAAVERGDGEETERRLADRYYRIRMGTGGFSKTPDVYGAFPLDPYSHTPAHAGARQPGMTGQVKEEIITRQGELGVLVRDGRISFRPLLLRKSEFLQRGAIFATFNVRAEPIEILLEPGTLAFTYCQVPVIYHLGENPRIALTLLDGSTIVTTDPLSRESSAAIFRRSGAIVRIDAWVRPGR